MDTTRDCQTCAHDIPADCGAPEYRAMTHGEQKAFWRQPDPPCQLWDAKPNELGHCREWRANDRT